MMDRERDEVGRREFLKKMLVAGVVGGAGASVLVRQVLAMGAGGQLLEGVRKAQGAVMINGIAAQAGSLVFPGDVITTGSASFGVFVVGKDAYLVRENSRIELSGEKGGVQPGVAGIVTSLKVAAGRVLSVFGSGPKRIETSTAIAGTRGTGIYVEMMSDVTYVCLCYGKVELDAKAYPGEQKTFATRHHESPYYILPAGMKQGFLKAPMLNHTDEELVMLESLVGRVPPFDKKPINLSGY